MIRRGLQGENEADDKSKHEFWCCVAFCALCFWVRGPIVFFDRKVSIIYRSYIFKIDLDLIKVRSLRVLYYVNW
jgi:hypothetical protein